MMNTGLPPAAAVAAIRRGSTPPPATMPSPAPMSASEFAAVHRLAYLPRGILADEVDDLGHRGRAGELLGDLLQPSLERRLARDKQAVGLEDSSIDSAVGKEGVITSRCRWAPAH